MQIAKEQLAIAKDKIKAEEDKTKAEKARLEKLEHATANALFSKGDSVEDLAKIMEITTKRVERIFEEINIL